MKKFLGTTWDDWVSIFVAVSVAEMALDAFKPEGVFLHLLIFFIG